MSDVQFNNSNPMLNGRKVCSFREGLVLDIHTKRGAFAWIQGFFNNFGKGMSAHKDSMNYSTQTRLWLASMEHLALLVEKDLPDFAANFATRRLTAKGQ